MSTKKPKVILFEGDLREQIKNLKKFKFRLIITSPPYNLGKEYEERKSLDCYLNSQKEIISYLIELLEENGSICWEVGNYIDPKTKELFPLDIFYYEIFKDLGLILRNRIIWYFGHGLHAKYRFSGRYETILWFTKNDEYIFNLDDIRVPSKYPEKKYYKGPKKGRVSSNPNGKNPSDVWKILNRDWEKEVWEIPNVKARHREKTIHPCQFPIELVERCVLALTNKNDWILDPFVGSGTSLIAAYKNSRNSIGVEINKNYIEVAKDRISKLNNGEIQYRSITKPIYKPK